MEKLPQKQSTIGLLECDTVTYSIENVFDYILDQYLYLYIFFGYTENVTHNLPSPVTKMS